MKTKNLFVKKLSLMMMFLFFSALLSINAQSWVDQTYNPDVPGIEMNPMKGLMPGYGINYTTMPYTTDHFYISLKEINTSEGVYDWTVFDRLMDTKGVGGRHVVPRVWCFYPSSSNPSEANTLGIPAWLKSKVTTYTGSTGVCPDWNDPVLIKALTDFIAAFGARCDNKPQIALIEAGLYGSWGEWNTVNSPTGVKAMNQANMDAIITAYDNAFNTTHIALRYGDKPSTEALARTVGYYDDSFCYSTLYTTWCFWPVIVAKGISDIWKTHQISGEMRPEIQQYIFDSWPNPTSGGGYTIEDLQNCVNTTHISLSKCSYLWSSNPTPTELTNAKKMVKMMGYNFYVRQAKLTPNADKTVKVEVNLQNKGIAPIYYNWAVEIGAKNTSTGAFTTIKSTNWGLKTMFPSTSDYYKAVTTNALANGTYKILMRFVNPLEALKGSTIALRFANSTQDADRTGWLTLGQVVVGSSGGTAPDVTALTAWKLGTTNDKLPGAERLMVVMVMGEHATSNFSATAVTYGGQSMTKVTEQVLGTTYRTYAAIFTLKESGVNLASSGTINVAWSTAPADFSVYSVLLANVDQTDVITSAKKALTGTFITTAALAAASGDMVVMCGATAANITQTFNNSFIKQFESNTGWGDGVGGNKMGTGVSETPKFTQSASGRMVLCAMVVKKSTVLKSAIMEGKVMDGENNDITIYPNPASNRLYIDFKEEGIKNIHIYNSNGQLVYSNRTSDFTAYIDVKALNIKGFAMIQIISDQKSLIKKVLIK